MKRIIIALLAFLTLIPVFGADTLAGEYIGGAEDESEAILLRKAFTIKAADERWVLRVNSLGYHEAYINGTKVTDAVLMPAVSQLNKRSLVVSYDVTNLIRKGRNELVLWIGSGWYKAKTFAGSNCGPLVKAELSPLTPHPSPLIITDASWQYAYSGHRDWGTGEAHRFGGEIIDGRVVPVSLSTKDLNKMDWKPVRVVTVEGMELSAQCCEPCRVQETLEPVSITADKEGRIVADFGRIVNAMIDITLPQLPAGDTTKVSFSDVRRDDGSYYFVTSDRYISSGRSGGDHFQSRFNHHVFRYVVIESTDTISTDISRSPLLAPRSSSTSLSIRAHRMRTDFRRTASFESSDEELNKIHDLVAYTLENLAYNGYMVDCANIERLGYGGDGNASTQTLQTLFDVERLYDNWLMAWRDAIHDDGSLPHTAPAPYFAGGGPYWCSFVVQAPWRTYMNYGHADVLRENYATMKLWLKYVDKYTVDGLLKKWPDQPDRWWYLGDWAAPRGVDVQNEASVDLVNNCVMCQVYLQLEQIARQLGEETDARNFRERYERLRETVHQRFYHPDEKTYATGSQIDMVYPMLVGVTPDSLRQVVRDKLMERTERVYDGHLSTGLVGVPVLTEWAVQQHEADWMYAMLKKHGYPGYLYMIDSGATGTWEHWDGQRSRLHNCFNGIGSWFYQALGGIVALEPGYQKVRIDPQIPKGLEWVRVTQDTPQGRIVVNRRGQRLHVELPEGITAIIQGRAYGGGSYDLVLRDTTRATKIVAELNNPMSDYVLVAAHRGDWRNHPENSLSAVESAIQMGVDIVEIDLKRTKDSVLVVCHDPTIDRTTNGRGYISDLTYDELMQYNLKTGHDIDVPGEKMPTLRQVLELCKDRVLVNVDQGYAYYPQVLKLARELGVEEQIVIKSGLPRSELLSPSPLGGIRGDGGAVLPPLGGIRGGLSSLFYMPVIGVSDESDMTVFNDYADAPDRPKAFELCFGKIDNTVRQAAQKVVMGGSRLWVNTLWASLCGGYHDDRAFESVDPNDVYGVILDLGTSIIQTDRPEFLIRYLEHKGRRTFNTGL